MLKLHHVTIDIPGNEPVVCNTLYADNKVSLKVIHGLISRCNISGVVLTDPLLRSPQLCPWIYAFSKALRKHHNLPITMTTQDANVIPGLITIA